MNDMPNYDDLWDTHCKLVDHCQKLDAEVKRLQGEIKRLRSPEGLIELCQAQRRKDDVAIRTWARRQREAAEAAKEGE